MARLGDQRLSLSSPVNCSTKCPSTVVGYNRTNHRAERWWGEERWALVMTRKMGGVRPERPAGGRGGRTGLTWKVGLDANTSAGRAAQAARERKYFILTGQVQEWEGETRERG